MITRSQYEIKLPHYQFHDQVDHIAGVQQSYKQTKHSKVEQSHLKAKKKQQQRKKNKRLRKPYSIEAPSVEDNHTVKSAPQAMLVTSSETTHGTGDDSTSTDTNPAKKKNTDFTTPSYNGN